MLVVVEDPWNVRGKAEELAQVMEALVMSEKMADNG